MKIENLNGTIRILAENNCKITDSSRSFFVDYMYIGKYSSPSEYEEVDRSVWKHFIEDNSSDFDVLNEGIDKLEKESLVLVSNHFDLDFRVFEIECTLDIDIYSNIFSSDDGLYFTCSKQYSMAKKLISSNMYKKDSMMYKINKYHEKGIINNQEYDELILLMSANDIIK